MGEDEALVDALRGDFLAAWGRGERGLSPAAQCTAASHYRASSWTRSAIGKRWPPE